MRSRASLAFVSAVTVSALYGCAYPDGQAGYGFSDGSGYAPYDDYYYGYGYAPGYGYVPPQSNLFFGFGGYSRPYYPYWRHGHHGHWSGGGRHWGGGGHSHGSSPPTAGGGGGAAAAHGPVGGGKAPAGRSVNISPNNGSRATNH
jgi:hypothetical protein